MTADLARHIRLVGRLLACVAAALWLVVMLAPGASAAPSRSGPSATTASAAAPACPKGAACQTIPAKCPTGTVCPEVIVSPATNLGSNQWVFVTAKHFPPGDPIYVYYCVDEHSLAYYANAQGGPLCMLQATAELLNPQVVLTASPSGTASISFATEENPSHDGNTAFDAKIPGSQTTGTFYCDDNPDPCSLDVTDPLLHSGGKVDLSLTPANATAVPVSFAKPTGGCPKASFVPTASEFGIEQLFPISAQFDCIGKAPAIAVNFAQDSLAAVTALAGGAYDMAFIDDPNAPDVQAALSHFSSGSNPGYALVPVAAQLTSHRVQGHDVGHLHQPDLPGRLVRPHAQHGRRPRDGLLRLRERCRRRPLRRSLRWQLLAAQRTQHRERLPWTGRIRRLRAGRRLEQHE